MISYLNGKFLKKNDIYISPDDRGFLMSDGIYEVIRSYQGHLFQSQQHIHRLNAGADALQFKQTNFEVLIEIAEELIKINNLSHKDSTVYMQITRGSVPRSHRFPSLETPLTIYVDTKEFFPKMEEIKNGVSAILVPDQRWCRCNIKSISLLANTMAHQQAIESGAQEAIFLRNGFLTEGSHTNVFLVKNNIVITPPKSNYILSGITREVLLDCCHDLHIPVEERPVVEKELFEADELMIVGTTVEVTPVIKLNHQTINKGTSGLITTKLYEHFKTTKLYHDQQ